MFTALSTRETNTFIGNTLLGPIQGVSGSGTLASIQFQPRSPGTTTITPLNILLLDSAARDISANVQTGSVTVIPEPNSGLLLASVIGLGLVGRYCLR
jgi:hypothetical protein